MLDSNILKAWLVRVLAMELLKHLDSVDKVDSRFPSPFTNFVTLPTNKILQFLPIDTRIKDLGDFKFFFALISIGGGGACSRPGIVNSLYSSSKET